MDCRTIYDLNCPLYIGGSSKEFSGVDISKNSVALNIFEGNGHGFERDYKIIKTNTTSVKEGFYELYGYLCICVASSVESVDNVLKSAFLG